MSPEEIRISIAKACGWKCNPIGGLYPPNLHMLGNIYHNYPIPDYLKDLNAMHEAEKILEDKWADYIIELGGLCQEPETLDWKMVCHASAAQRAEAFLKTIGKWEPTREQGKEDSNV